MHNTWKLDLKRHSPLEGFCFGKKEITFKQPRLSRESRIRMTHRSDFPSSVDVSYFLLFSEIKTADKETESVESHQSTNSNYFGAR